MEKMRELGDLGWELRRCLEAFLHSVLVSRGIRYSPKAAHAASQPQELSCTIPALTARLPSQSFNLLVFSYLIQMKGIRRIHMQSCLWSCWCEQWDRAQTILDTLQESQSSRGRCVRGCTVSFLSRADRCGRITLLDVLKQSLWSQVF